MLRRKCGPQVPIFLERADGITSYKRLGKEDGGSGTNYVIVGCVGEMERGTRPGVGQLEFYGNAEDVLKADEMSR